MSPVSWTLLGGWAACLAAFVGLALTAPTLDYMNDSLDVQR